MQKVECEFKFTKLDIFLKIKPDSVCMWKFEKLKSWHSCEIYLTVHDGNHETDFCDGVPNKKN